MSFSQWINDMRWAMNVKRVRSWRRKLTFAQRKIFDDALRPELPVRLNPTRVIAYPDAFYEITVDDLCRAIIAVSLSQQQKE